MNEPRDGDMQEILVKLAVIDTKLDSLVSSRTDHEARLRSLETLATADRGGRDATARWVSLGAAFVSAGSMAAAWVAILHH